VPGYYRAVPPGQKPSPIEAPRIILALMVRRPALCGDAGLKKRTRKPSRRISYPRFGSPLLRQRTQGPGVELRGSERRSRPAKQGPLPFKSPHAVSHWTRDITSDIKRRKTRRKAILASISNPLYLFQMQIVTLSSKYQVVIPRSVRVSLGLRPGMKLQVIAYNGRVEFLPVRKPAELRGLLRGLEPVIERESDRL